MKISKQIKFSKENYLIAYKLLYDALFLAIISFAGLMLAEGVLPGLVSQHVSFTRVVFVIFLIIFFIISIGKKFDITYPLPKIRTKSLPFLIIFIFLLIGNSLLKFALWENITITIVTLVIFYLFFDLFFNEK